MARFERRDAVVALPRWAAPHHDVAVAQRYALRRVGALDAAEEEDGRNAE